MTDEITREMFQHSTVVIAGLNDHIEALTAENERLRLHLDIALETLAEEGVCGDECNTCKEARAALGEK